MKKLLLLALLPVMALAAQIESSTMPNMVLGDKDCVPLEGVSASSREMTAAIKARDLGPGEYCVIRPNGRIVIGGEAVEPEPEPTPVEPEPTPTPEPVPTPEPISGSFAECMAAYEAGVSGWCQLSGQTFDSVRLPDAEAGVLKGSTGSKSVMIAWTGAAIDRQRGILYFTGGGHNDYYGNEVYAYHYLTDQWERLTDPAPYDHYYPSSLYGFCKVPDPQKSPPSAHSYDGIEFHPERGTLWLINQGTSANCTTTQPTGTQIAVSATANGIWEFNPSRTETRAGLAPLTWRRLGSMAFKYPRSEWVNGQMLMGSNFDIYRVSVDANNQFVLGPKVFNNPDAGEGSLTAIGDTLYTYMSSGWLWSKNLTTGVSKTLIGNYTYAPVRGQMECGKVCLVWGGNKNLTLYDGAANSYSVLSHDTGPVNSSTYTGKDRAYSKWRYLPKYDVFIGVSSNNQPVYLYKHGVEPVTQAPDPDEGSQDYDLALNIEDSGPFI